MTNCPGSSTPVQKQAAKEKTIHVWKKEEITTKDTKSTKSTKKKIDDLSHRVIGCAIDIHRELGPGLRNGRNSIPCLFLDSSSCSSWPSWWSFFVGTS